MITIYVVDGKIHSAAKDHRYIDGAEKIEVVDGKLVVTYPGPLETVELTRPFKSR